MKQKRNYPLFIVDKTTSEAFPHHHIAVMGENPFVIRVRVLKNLDVTPCGAFYLHSLSSTVILFEVVSTKDDGPQIQSLLKKAAKKYMLSYRDNNYKGKDLSLDNQIHQQYLTIEHNKRNFDKLVERAGGNAELAKFNIAMAEATLASLKKLKDIL